jgi:hypothetical protein
MQYMLLIYNDPAKEPAYGSPEFQEMMAGFFAANEKMKEDGVLRSGEGLQGVETATSLRIKSGKVETMGGYYVIDVPDLDAALTYAALIPAAHFGTIEVRPLMDYNPMG